MKLFRQMPFAALDHQPCDRQSSFSINQADHKGNTVMAYFTPIDNKNQFTYLCKNGQQITNERQVIAFIINAFILNPTTVTLDPTIGFGQIGRFSRDRRQLATLSLDNPGDHRSQGVQHAGFVPFWFSWQQLFDSHSNGTIHSTIVTHVISCSSLIEITGAS